MNWYALQVLTGTERDVCTALRRKGVKARAPDQRMEIRRRGQWQTEDRLLLRHAELQRTNALLADQVAALTQERDSLKSRLSAARARVDALLERLPAAAPLTKEAE